MFIRFINILSNLSLVRKLQVRNYPEGASVHTYCYSVLITYNFLYAQHFKS